MGRITLGVAIVGIATSIALAVRSQIKNETPRATVTPAAATQTRPDSLTPGPESSRTDAQAAPAALEQDTSAKKTGSRTTAKSPSQPVLPVRPPHPPIVENAENFQVPSTATILGRAAGAYARLQASSADFVLERTNPLLGSTTNSRGKVYQKKPDRFLMKFTDPAGDVIVGDGNYFWIYYPSADRRQVLRAPAEQGAGGVDLQTQFLGDPVRRFSSTFHGIERVNGRPAYVLTLVPRSNAGYKSLKVWIDTKDYLARRFILTEGNGVTQDFTLSNLALNPQLSMSLFKFTPPAGAHIVERP